MPRTTRLTNFGQPAGATSFTGKVSLQATQRVRRAPASVPRHAAEQRATSRAMPSTDMASPRFGVTLSSRISSSSCRYARRSLPTGASAGSSRMPSEVSARPSSFAEHNMPKDSTPRSFAALMALSPGSFAPTVASAVLSPARAFAAPQTICSGSPDRRDLAHLQLVGLRMRAASRISATTTPVNGGAAVSMRFELEAGHRQPRAQLLARSTGTSTHSRSHESGTLMAQPALNCARKRRSFSKNRRRSFTP